MRSNERRQPQPPHVKEFSDFARKLRQLHDETKSWRLVGDAIGCSGAHARMVALERRTPKNYMLVNYGTFDMGELVKTDEVPVCDKCGIAHTYDCTRHRVTNKRPRRKRRRYYRPCLSPEYSDYSAAEIEAILDAHTNAN